jgi:hypothetical protein
MNPKQDPMETQHHAQNIAENERMDTGDTKAAILMACKTLGLNPQEAEKRYELAGGEDLKKKEGIYFILTGNPYPNKKGYQWA